MAYPNQEKKVILENSCQNKKCLILKLINRKVLFFILVYQGPNWPSKSWTNHDRVLVKLVTKDSTFDVIELKRVLSFLFIKSSDVN